MIGRYGCAELPLILPDSSNLEELDSFLLDASPDAYEKVVRRLLKSDEYAERMSAEWMDVARYSDTFGYQVDKGVRFGNGGTGLFDLSKKHALRSICD